MKVKSLSHVWLLATPWTAGHQAPPSMGFSRQEYWSGVPLLSPGGIYKCYKKKWIRKRKSQGLGQNCSCWAWHLPLPQHNASVSTHHSREKNTRFVDFVNLLWGYKEMKYIKLHKNITSSPFCCLYGRGRNTMLPLHSSFSFSLLHPLFLFILPCVVWCTAKGLMTLSLRAWHNSRCSTETVT